jgi:imidazolonepropionase-like amidohydrolase
MNQILIPVSRYNDFRPTQKWYIAPHDGHVKGNTTDMLMHGNRIVKNENNINSDDASTEVVDCTSNTICPGFIDIQYHHWQTQLKGHHANEPLLDYFASGN